MPSDEYSLTVGPDGPILLQDNYLIEQMANFNRERIPERHRMRKVQGPKRCADSGLRDNDMQWDFWTLSPGSAHQVTWLMGDRGIPRTWLRPTGIVGHLKKGVSAPVLKRAFDYWRNIDKGVGDLIARGIHTD